MMLFVISFIKPDVRKTLKILNTASFLNWSVKGALNFELHIIGIALF